MNDKLYIFLGSAKERIEYMVTVVTGDRKGAGTDATVSLAIKGTRP